MLLLKDITLIDYKDFSFQSGDLLVEKGNAARWADTKDLPIKPEILDCSGMLAMKSFACGHHHVYSALARGMGAPRKIPQNFLEILQYVWWTLDKCLDRDMIEASALYTAMTCAKNGVTFAIDHHASPFAVEGSLEIIAQAFEKVGIGHLLCYEISDRDGEEIAEKGLEETRNYLEKHQGLLGLHAAFTVGDKTLKKAIDLSLTTNTGLHVHTAEDVFDQEFSIKNYQKRVVERFAEAGALSSPASIFVHCLHLDDKERKLLEESPCWVAQNADSNQNNKVGNFSSIGLGENIMLGTDGMHSDMLRSAKSAFLSASKSDGLDYGGTWQRLRKVHQYLESNQFTGDGPDNLVILDYPSPTPVHQNNFLSHFIFGLESSHVRHVISRGKLIVKDRELKTQSETDILKYAREQAPILWEKMSKIK